MRENAKRHGKKVAKMVNLDDDLVDLYFRKYGKGTLSARINSLLRGFLYISFSEENEKIEEISEKIEKKLETIAKTRTEIIELEQIKEEMEHKHEKKKKELEKQLKLQEENEKKCLYCLKITEEGMRMEIAGGYMHNSCFKTAPSSVINDILKKNKIMEDKK